MTQKLTFWLFLTLWFFFKSSVWAGDIKPLHVCVQSGLFQQSLGTAATAKDIYRVSCPVGTKSFQANVRDRVPVATPVLNIRVIASSNAGSSDGVRSDTVDGNGSTAQCALTGFSAYSTYTLNAVSTAPVTFTFEVYKNAAGAETYDLGEHCRPGNLSDYGNGTNLIVLQNQ
ncbi:MAG: hypothetical protein IPN42_02850 [Methylococcaceae bacterium]|nr:hypothetical protein [Methylococcaceae bacterium]